MRGVFRSSPVYAATAVLSLGIGIGANTTIFSILNSLFIEPLPYQDADRLAILWNRSPGLNIAEDWFSTAQYFDIRNGTRSFEQVAIAIGGTNNLTGDGEPERVGTIRMSSNLLPMLGVKAAIGRLFAADEDRLGRAPVALLSHGLWMRRYGGDRGITGRRILINAQPYEVAGVLPPSFTLPREVLPTLGGADQADIVLPLPLDEAAVRDRDHEDYNVIGKLRRGIGAREAQAEMDTLTARLRRDYPAVYPPNGGLTFGVVPLRAQAVGDTRRPLYILLGSVGFVLLIACVNMANLSLSRAVGRRKELAVRAALGASRRRMVAEMLRESLTLALMGGAAGVLLAVWSLNWIRALGPGSIPRVDTVSLDGRVLAFTFVVSVMSGLIFGVIPAFRATGIDVQDALKEGGRGSAGMSSLWGRGNHLRRLMVTGELALSVVLLVGAGLLIRSFLQLENVNPGFNPDHVLTFALSMSGHKYNDPAKVLGAYRELFERIEQTPGVTAAGSVTSLPLGGQFAWGPIVVEGRTPAPGENFINADIRIVNGHYFEAMRIPLRRGRLFNEQDTADHPRVVLVDEYMAAQLWPGQDPIGKRIRNGGLAENAPWETVVGVVGRVKQYGLDSDARIAFYVPQTQSTVRAMSAAIRGDVDPAALAGVTKSVVRGIDPDLPVHRVRTMRAWVDESLARRRFAMTMLAVFAGVALLLAAIGTYGVMSYLVSHGTREIGIRMALGATQASILGMVVGRGMLLAGSGVVLGCAAAMALARLIRGLLFGVAPTDAMTFVAVAGVLGAVALAATCVPARRAARVDPMVALRAE